MSISGQAIAARSAPRPLRQQEIAEKHKPISEQYRLKGLEWSDAHSAAELLDDLKKPTLAKLASRHIRMGEKVSEAKGERLALCSVEWGAYLEQLHAARKKANDLRIELAEIKMRHSEWVGANADARSERRL